MVKEKRNNVRLLAYQREHAEQKSFYV